MQLVEALTALCTARAQTDSRFLLPEPPERLHGFMLALTQRLKLEAVGDLQRLDLQQLLAHLSDLRDRLAKIPAPEQPAAQLRGRDQDRGDHRAAASGPVAREVPVSPPPPPSGGKAPGRARPPQEGDSSQSRKMRLSTATPKSDGALSIFQAVFDAAMAQAQFEAKNNILPRTPMRDLLQMYTALFTQISGST